MARRPLLAGNWKMNGLTEDGLDLARRLAERARTRRRLPFDLVLCPPFTLLAPVRLEIDGTPLALGAQDCHPKDKGAHTGDVSAAMLADLGCRYVIVGHSERRTGHAEANALVRAKAEAAQRAGLTAIICVGESEAERDRGHAASVVTAQLEGSVPPGASAANTAIAYEPVWAIGSGRTPTLAEIREIHALVRAELAVRFGDGEAPATRILYGGSVKPANAKEILALADVDGALVGGASLVAADFWAIATSLPAAPR